MGEPQEEGAAASPRGEPAAGLGGRILDAHQRVAGVHFLDAGGAG